MNLFKKIQILGVVLIFSTTFTFGQIIFNEFFTKGTLRVDFILEGDHQNSSLTLESVSKQDTWGGNPENLIDPYEYGEYKFHIIHEKSNKLIFSRGFGTLFEEWQTTTEAKTESKAFDQVILFPQPLTPVILEIYVRNENNVFQSTFRTRLDPNNLPLSESVVPTYSYRRITDSGDPSENLDIVFLAEGYTAADSLKFYGDAYRFASEILNTEPFKELHESINFWAVASLSEEKGSDLPGESIWKNTVMNSNFYTFGSERYLMTEDIKSVRDIAGIVPYDVICILVNTEKYGGGGIYNHYAITSSDNPYAALVLVHELGHALAGLGDEYYTSSVAYEGFFNLSAEPWQPNLTTLVDFESKWKDLLSDTIPVPTPSTEEFMNVTGVFEGGGYVAKGMYRAEFDCRMKSNNTDKFCSACSRAIRNLIDYHCGR